MHVAQTKDTMSDLYLDAVRLRQRVFVAEQGYQKRWKSMNMKHIVFTLFCTRIM